MFCRLFYLSVILIFFCNPCFAQGDSSNSNQITNISSVQRNLNETNTESEKLRSAVDELKKENAVLKESVTTLTIIFFYVAGLISVVLIVGTTTSFISWNTDRKRSNETYYLARKNEQEVSERQKVLTTRQDKLYDLSISREHESAERDKRIFAQSTDTLILVNETLELARDASERASKSLEERLNRQHKELEQEAVDLIETSKASKYFKVVVENSRFRSDLVTLAMEIAGLQNNQNILDREVLLHPHCSFVRGMEYHLNQHYKPAIKYWKQCKDHKEAPVPLRLMALYWLGYEQDNLGDYENAAAFFEAASIMAAGPMKYELERMQVQSRFFDVSRFTTKKIIPEIESLHLRAQDEKESEEFQKVKSSIALTLGNVYFQYANELSTSEKKKAESNTFYKKAKEIYRSAPIQNKWLSFGYADACYKLGEKDVAEEYFLHKVKKEAELDYFTRPEPRTKVLGQTTVLICSVRVKSLHDDVNSIYNGIKTTLGGVDEELTVYSQFRRRNVFKEEFLSDLEAIMMEFDSSRALDL